MAHNDIHTACLTQIRSRQFTSTGSASFFGVGICGTSVLKFAPLAKLSLVVMATDEPTRSSCL